MKQIIAGFLWAGLCMASDDLVKLRDRQDRAALEKNSTALQAAAEKMPGDAKGWYEAATAYSYLAEVAYELHDKAASERAATAGVKDAEKAIAINGKVGDYYRILGTLCGQVIPANPLMGALAYGKRAKEALETALQMDPKSPKAHVAHGVGFYYLPTNFGGGPENAIKDYRQAIALDPKNAEAYLWLGVAYAKTHQNKEAREAFTKSLQLDPDRLWTKEQLNKVPAQ
jgi:tetratricopeptide (TPR) repeat protein